MPKSHVRRLPSHVRVESLKANNAVGVLLTSNQPLVSHIDSDILGVNPGFGTVSRALGGLSEDPPHTHHMSNKYYIKNPFAPLLITAPLNTTGDRTNQTPATGTPIATKSLQACVPVS